MTQRTPLVVVLGATACGKSRLAIELAKRFQGEIISADSMQVYRGLDIVTNKVTEEEQQQAKHHMISFLDPMIRYSVVDFRNHSLDIISKLHKQSQLPVVVGGTNYYIESLLWKSFLIGPALESKKRSFEEEIGPNESLIGGDDEGTLIDSEAKLLSKLSKETLHTDEDFENVEKFFDKPIYNDAFAHVDSQKLWKILEQVDSKSAHIYHPHDRRRVIRSLQVIQAKRRNFSDILESVNKSGESDKPSLGGPLRYQPTCVIWLHCDNQVLDKILDERVDQMLDRGLLAELENFHDDYNRQRIAGGERPNYDKGIFQSIGFKEFHDYLMLSADTRATEEGNRVLRKSIEEMKLSTRKYARRQLKWIRRRFLQNGTRDLPLLFKLTTAFDEEGWQRQVHEPAIEIVESIIKGDEFSPNLLAYKQDATDQEIVNNPGKYECQACDRVLIGSYNIEAHLKSKTHLRNLRRLAATDELKRQKTTIEDTTTTLGSSEHEQQHHNHHPSATT